MLHGVSLSLHIFDFACRHGIFGEKACVLRITTRRTDQTMLRYTQDKDRQVI